MNSIRRTTTTLSSVGTRSRPTALDVWSTPSVLSTQRPLSTLILGLLVTLGIGASTAVAGGSKDFQPLAMSEKYRSECASCHLAYPPALLPLASWRRLRAPIKKCVKSHKTIVLPRRHGLCANTARSRLRFGCAQVLRVLQIVWRATPPQSRATTTTIL